MSLENESILEMIEKTIQSWKEAGSHPGEMVYEFTNLLQLLEHFDMDKIEVSNWVKNLSSTIDLPLIFSIPSNDLTRALLMLYKPLSWSSDSIIEWEICVEEYYGERYGQHIDWID